MFRKQKRLGTFTFCLGTPYLGLVCTQSLHMRMGHICSHVKQHGGVTFGDFVLLRLNKQVIEDKD